GAHDDHVGVHHWPLPSQPFVACPRDPYVVNNTRISRLPFPWVLASAGDYPARPGACRKPPCAVQIESGEEWVTALLIVRCGWTTSREGLHERWAKRSVDHPAMITPRTRPPLRLRHQRLDPSPRR